MSFVERCRQRHLGSEGGDEGFTLIELLVVLLIIGILLAIAIPTFLSVTKGANNTAAQSNLQNALTGAKTYYTDSNQSYQGLTTGVQGSIQTSDIQAIGTGLSYVTTLSTGPHVISYNVSANYQVLTLAAWAPGSNDCWVILDVTGTQSATTAGFTGSTATGTYYGVLRNSTSAACVATGMTVPTGTAQSTAGFPSG